MRRPGLLLPLWLFVAAPLRAAEPPSTPVSEDEDLDQTKTMDESDDTGIIPKEGLVISTAPITPISPFVEKPPYDQGLQELEQAKTLWAKGNAEAASDTAFQAYEDFYSIHARGKRNQKKRAKLRALRYQAAAIYLDSSVAYVRQFVKERGSTPAAMDEGRTRLQDLREVAREYPDLNGKLNRALEELALGR